MNLTSLTAAELVSPAILTMVKATMEDTFTDHRNDLYVSLRFRTIMDSAAYVAVNELTKYMHIDTIVTEFDQSTVVTFAYTAYDRDNTTGIPVTFKTSK